MGRIDHLINEFSKMNFIFVDDGEGSYKMSFQGTTDRFTIFLHLVNFSNGIIFCEAISPIDLDTTRNIEFINFFNSINLDINHGIFSVNIKTGEFKFGMPIVFLDDNLTFPMLENPVRFVGYMMNKYIPVIEAVQNGSSPDEALKLID